MFLEKQAFEKVIASTPLISIDLVVKNPQQQYLLGCRNNRPAKGYWFVPGGRILKNETLAKAFTRLCQQELGLEKNIAQAKFLGPFEHFYDDCVFSDNTNGSNVSSHYVVLAYEIMVNITTSLLPVSQHNAYQWLTKDEILSNKNVHQHSQWYFS